MELKNARDRQQILSGDGRFHSAKERAVIQNHSDRRTEYFTSSIIILLRKHEGRPSNAVRLSWGITIL